MPTAYEKTYGAVAFYEPDGTPIFDTEADLGLWTTMDSEPSPEPKWIRVSVPGADGAVDLSRALAGQVTYEMREIRLGFSGECADHATALALVHQMRRALHGARVRVETLLTKRIGGYYVADCECDGTADAGGGVEVTVSATADPFIRVGNQTLALPAQTSRDRDALSVQDVPTGGDPSVATYTVRMSGVISSADVQDSPVMATSARLWWAMGDNLFDPTLWPYETSDHFSYSSGVFDGRVRLAASLSDGATVEVKASSATGTWPSWPHSFPFGWFGSLTQIGVDPSGQRLVAHVTGTVYSVGSSPSVTVTAIANGIGTDADGFVQGLTASASAALSTGNVDQTLVIDLASATWSGSGATALSAIRCEVSGARADIRIYLMLTCDPTLTTWEAPTLGYSDVAWATPIGWYDAMSDSVSIGPVDSYVRHFVYTDGGGTSTGRVSAEPWLVEPATVTQTPPSNAKWVSASVGQTGGQTGATWLYGTYPTPATATGTNTTMRSIPSITTNHGAEVTIDGRTATVGPGTYDLPALAVPGGTFTVGYSLFGSNPSDATLTWEGGVL